MKWERKNTGRLVVTENDMILIKGIYAGEGAKELAAKLFISPRTIEYRTRKLKEIFKVKSREGIAVAAFAYGLIEYEKPETV